MHFWKTAAVAACVFTACALSAQTPAKNLSQFLKASCTAPKCLGKTGVLSASQRHMLQSNFIALEETRRAIKQNPGWAVSAQFEKTAQRLSQLGLNLPAKPQADASTAEKENYLRQLNAALYQESQALGSLVNEKPRPLATDASLQHQPAQALRIQGTSRQAWEEILRQQQPNASWGTPNWDEVRIVPAQEFTNVRSPFYVTTELMEKVTSNPQISEEELYDLILSEKDMADVAKQQLIVTLAGTSSVLTHNFTRLYLYLFGQVPTLQVKDGLPTADQALEKYAVSLHKRLIKKLEANNGWTDQEFEMFAEASVYLPAAKAKAVLGAVTYLEPTAALWLLEHPLDNAVSRRIIARTQAIRQQKDVLWPNGNIQPKAMTHINFKRLQLERLQALQAYEDILTERLNKLMNIDYNTRHAERILSSRKEGASAEEQSERLAGNIMVSARNARVQKLINQTHVRLQQTQEEIKALSDD